jgi:hypothetical protein
LTDNLVEAKPKKTLEFSHENGEWLRGPS